MIYLALDLEMCQPSGRIIQLGACIGDVVSGELYSSFSQLVLIDETITPFIEKLTGISNADMHADGVPLIEAYKRLLEYRASYAGQIECNPLTWGGGDSWELRKQLQAAYDKIIIGKVFDWPFGRRWLDAKTLFQFRQIARGEKPEAGLVKALRKCRLNFEGRAHDAKDDAINTFRITHHLLQEMRR